MDEKKTGREKETASNEAREEKLGDLPVSFLREEKLGMACKDIYKKG